ncbi:hypothetical protein Thimo_1720 [Thioflavicoccus mobilis 8321]|uniref:DUF29 domain-containing protein n=1 Tax=Thioflavicoccus mobilis 8321 TaxID=765912 RepID=L0GYQ7_9GAMM|nr:hypothetical protein Thimo_1720 [Thioflavicoccus mobilis 8321]
MTSQLYDTDFLRWTEEQAALRRAAPFNELYYEHTVGPSRVVRNEMQ